MIATCAGMVFLSTNVRNMAFLTSVKLSHMIQFELARRSPRNNLLIWACCSTWTINTLARSRFISFRINLFCVAAKLTTSLSLRLVATLIWLWHDMSSCSECVDSEEMERSSFFLFFVSLLLLVVRRFFPPVKNWMVPIMIIYYFVVGCGLIVALVQGAWHIVYTCTSDLSLPSSLATFVVLGI
jgi:hypothetical protein